MQGSKRRKAGTTVFLDLATMELFGDQWAFLSSVDRMTPRDLSRALGRVGEPAVGSGVGRLVRSGASRITVTPPDKVRVRVGARVTIEAADLTPAISTTLMHASSMRNPEFDLRQRGRRPTWGVPRFLRFHDQTLDGGLVLPRGRLGLVETLVAERGGGGFGAVRPSGSGGRCRG